MIKTFCDVCNREVTSFEDAGEYKIKVKKRWYSWHEKGWEKAVICEDCKQSFHELYKRIREEKQNGNNNNA